MHPATAMRVAESSTVKEHEKHHLELSCKRGNVFMPFVVLVANRGAFHHNASLPITPHATIELDVPQCCFPEACPISGPDSEESDTKRHQPHPYLVSTHSAAPHPETFANVNCRNRHKRYLLKNTQDATNRDSFVHSCPQKGGIPCFTNTL